MNAYQKRKKRSQELVIDYLKRSNGICTIFWVTETQARAIAVEQLERSGVLVRKRDKNGELKGIFPHMHYTINLKKWEFYERQHKI